MKIREGAYYRTRDGDVAGPMRRTKDQSWYSNYRTWNEDGGIFSSGAEHGLDLISEVYVSNAPPAIAPAMQARRDAMEELERHFREAAAGTPLGHEDHQRGASTYNWLSYCATTISAIKDRAAAGEVKP